MRRDISKSEFVPRVRIKLPSEDSMKIVLEVIARHVYNWEQEAGGRGRERAVRGCGWLVAEKVVVVVGGGVLVFCVCVNCESVVPTQQQDSPKQAHRVHTL